MSANEQRRLAAIMFTDMVGYSALSQRDDKLAQELLEEHRRLLREIFPRFNGTEIKTIGDAFLAEFNSALEAAQCAIEIQRTLAKRNADAPADRQIELKIGIHIGDVVHRGGDVYGDGVNIASRIEQLAGAGGICVSMDVERQIRNAVETRFEKLAPTELKNISVPMELFRIVLPWERQKSEVRDRKSEVGQNRVSSARAKWIWAAAGAAAALLLMIGSGWWWNTRTQRISAGRSENTFADSGRPSGPSLAVTEKSIAVLPFENLSSDKENAYFVEGIQDEILTRLSKIAALKVISRTSTQKYKSAPDNLREVGRQLGVANLLEGSVQKIANAVHVNVQLIRAATDEHLWAESYNRKLDDVFGVEGEVAGAIAEQLKAKLSNTEKQELAAKPTNNQEAYDAYLRGSAENWRDNETALNAAVHSFEEAVHLDPQFAQAWAALARAHSLAFFHYDKTPSRRAAAEKALNEAIRLQPDLTDTQLARGYFEYWVEHDFQGALALMQQLRPSLPNNVEILQIISFISARLGKWQDSVDSINKAVALNPRDLFTRLQASQILMATRNFTGVVQLLDNALQIWPNNTDLLGRKAFALQASGRLDDAQSLLSGVTPNFDQFDSSISAFWVQARLQRSPEAAIKTFEPHMQTITRENLSVLLLFGDLLQLAGRKPESQAVFAQGRDRLEAELVNQPNNTDMLGPLAYAYAWLGQRDAAQKDLDKFEALASGDARATNTFYDLRSRIMARLGQKDEAISSLERALSQPCDGITGMPPTPALLRLDPDYDSLRGDPRFEKLCQEK
jgi:class 3 adenylate cyclase/TolB-like protein/Tfp pilus assembly protein PilF